MLSTPHLSARVTRSVFISIIAGIGLYFIGIVSTDYEPTKQAILSFPVEGWLIILGLSLVNYLLRFLRWDIYIQTLSKIRIKKKYHLAYYLGGFALSTTPGKAGETIRSLYLIHHGITFTQSISVFFVERFLDLLTITLLSFAVVYLFSDYTLIVIITTVVAISLLPLMHSQFFINGLTTLSTKLHNKRLSGIISHLTNLLQSSSQLLKNRMLYGGLGIGMVAWAAEGIGLWILLHYLGQDIAIMAAVGIYAIAVLVGALSLLPGGLGTTDVVMAILLVSLGIDHATAVAATLICRVATLWFAVLLGFIMIGLLFLRGITPSTSITDEG